MGDSVSYRIRGLSPIKGTPKHCFGPVPPCPLAAAFPDGSVAVHASPLSALILAHRTSDTLLTRMVRTQNKLFERRDQHVNPTGGGATPLRVVRWRRRSGLRIGRQECLPPGFPSVRHSELGNWRNSSGRQECLFSLLPIRGAGTPARGFAPVAGTFCWPTMPSTAPPGPEKSIAPPCFLRTMARSSFG